MYLFIGSSHCKQVCPIHIVILKYSCDIINNIYGKPLCTRATSFNTAFNFNVVKVPAENTRCLPL